MIEPMTSRPRSVPRPDVQAPTREARRLSTLLEVSQALSGTLNLKASLHRVLEILARHHGAVRGIVSILQADGELRPARRAMQKRRLAADARHDDRLAALHDAPGDPLADLVADRARRVAHAVGGLDMQRAAGVEQRHEAADGAVLIR